MSPIIKAVICGLCSGVGAAFFFTVAYMIDKRKKKKAPICDSCEKLESRLKRHSSTMYRYRCSEGRGFDKPPEYCKFYKSRETEDGE